MERTGVRARLPALCIINAVFFHVLPSLQAQRPNPGLFTASLLYLPLGIWAYAAAGSDGVLGAGALPLSLLLGALAMAAALVMLVLGDRLGYSDVSAGTASDRQPLD